MRINKTNKLTDNQFKMMRASMIAKDEAGFMGLKFLFSLAVFLVLLPLFFPLAFLWLVVCTIMAMNERGNRATLKAAKMITKSQKEASRQARKDQRRNEVKKTKVTGYKMRPCDYQYN